MYYNTSEQNVIVIKRHYILLLIKILRFVFLIFVAFFLYFIYTEFLAKLDNSLAPFLHYGSFLIIFWLLNYAFIKLILNIIEYYHTLIIITDEQILIINCSLIMKDDIESIDAYRIMKIDAFSHWFWSNIIGYGNLVIEQQKDEVRTFHFIPHPYKIFGIIRDHKKQVFEWMRSKVVYENNNTVNSKKVEKKWSKIVWVITNKIKWIMKRK